MESSNYSKFGRFNYPKSDSAFICICSQEYIGYYRTLYNSLKKHAPDSDQILYFIGEDIPTEFDQVVDLTSEFNEMQKRYNNTLVSICALRPKVCLHTLNVFPCYKKVVFLGAKVEFFDHPSELLDPLDDYLVVGTPHIMEPLPEDGKFPANDAVFWTGQISTDVISYRNHPDTIKFLEWYTETLRTKCETTKYTYLDQSWLNHVVFFLPNQVYICPHLGYNVAYWNYTQRGLNFDSKRPEMKDGTPLVCFQYSGLDRGSEAQISHHQNRYTASGKFLEFLKSYIKRCG